MNLNFLASLAFKLPDLIKGAVAIKDQIKDKHGKDKHDEIVAEIPDMLDLVKLGVGKDFLNDAAVSTLISSYISTEAASLKAKNALRDGILNKS